MSNNRPSSNESPNANRLSLAARSGVNSRPALMTHVVLGYPSLAESIQTVEAMSKAGAAVIELQIPFSDPMADGPTIMRANEIAINNGVTPVDCVKAMAELSSRIETPLLFMSYCNLVFGYKQKGFEQFCLEASEAGAAGLIVPDVPLEETDDGYWNISRQYDLCPISLVSPVTEEKRLDSICQDAQGFIYCVATTGTTGVRENIPAELPQYLAKVGKHSDLPLAVGFGISSAEQVQALSGHADMAIVGSAMIQEIESNKSKNLSTVVQEFTRQLVTGT